MKNALVWMPRITVSDATQGRLWENLRDIRDVSEETSLINLLGDVPEICKSALFDIRHASSGGVQGVRTPALLRYSPNCVIKSLNKFRRNALKNQFKKRKNPSKQCTNSILLKFFNATLRRILNLGSHQ